MIYSKIQKINKFFDQPVDISSLIFFRISFGLIMLWEMIVYFYMDWINENYIYPSFHFKYQYFEWVKPFDSLGMHIVFFIMTISCLSIIFGYFYRVGSSFLFIGQLYIFLIDQSYYNNHFYLVCLLTPLIMIIPMNSSFSLDVYWNNHKKQNNLPFIWLWLLRFHMGLVYFYGGIAKLDPGWLDGSATAELMVLANKGTLFERILELEWGSKFYSWSGLFFDLFITFFLLNKSFRPYAFIIALFFHLHNSYVFHIGIFPWLAITLTALFFQPDFPKKIFLYLNLHYFKSNSFKNSASKRTKIIHVNSFVKSFIIFYIIVQLIIPFRHLLHPGKTSWHEVDHYFSWRMMLRQKVTKIRFNIIHPQTGEKRYADLSDYLSPSQIQHFPGNPGMILQFAHFLDRLVKINTDFDPIITSDILVSLNGRPFKTLVDPKLDLSEIKPFEPAFNWINPY